MKELATHLQRVFDSSVGWTDAPRYSFGDLIKINERPPMRCIGIRFFKGSWHYIFLIDGLWETLAEQDIVARQGVAYNLTLKPIFALGENVSVPVLGIDNCVINGFVLRRRPASVSFGYWTQWRSMEVLFDESDILVVNDGKK